MLGQAGGCEHPTRGLQACGMSVAKGGLLQASTNSKQGSRLGHMASGRVQFAESSMRQADVEV